MSYLQSFVAKVDVALPRYFGALNVLSFLLLLVTLFLPVSPSLVVLVLSILIQAAFFRVMHREKVGVNKLLQRLAFLVISSAFIFAILFRHNLL